jgi:ribosomal protein L10
VDRAAKQELVANLNGVFKNTAVVVVARNSGLTVAQMQNLRKQMKQAGAAVKVTKNRLVEAGRNRWNEGNDTRQNVSSGTRPHRAP